MGWNPTKLWVVGNSEAKVTNTPQVKNFSFDGLLSAFDPIKLVTKSKYLSNLNFLYSHHNQASSSSYQVIVVWHYVPNPLPIAC